MFLLFFKVVCSGSHVSFQGCSSLHLHLDDLLSIFLVGGSLFFGGGSFGWWLEDHPN